VRKSLLAVALLSIFVGKTFADVPTVDPVRHSGGMAQFPNNKQFAPSSNPIRLEYKDPSSMTSGDRSVAAQAEHLINSNATTAILLIEKGKIIFEKYKEPATQSSPLFSQSMSKSLTAMTIGKMLCDGKIADLDQTADTYTPGLKGMAVGNATVRQLLMMSSGAKDAVHAGSSSPTEWIDLRDGKLSIEQLWKDRAQPEMPPGKEFRYNAIDTFALSEIADKSGGFFNEFNEIWKDAGTESTGYWLYANDGRPMSASGVSATARDWARLAMYSIRQLHSSNQCISKFMKEATSPQIRNGSKRIGKAFDHYGYQMWIGSFRMSPSYWWVGYGGQRVGVDPVNERIIVLTSYREDYMGDVYKLFGFWQRN